MESVLFASAMSGLVSSLVCLWVGTLMRMPGVRSLAWMGVIFSVLTLVVLGS